MLPRGWTIQTGPVQPSAYGPLSLCPGLYLTWLSPSRMHADPVVLCMGGGIRPCFLSCFYFNSYIHSRLVSLLAFIWFGDLYRDVVLRFPTVVLWFFC
jgi:hypothetical protein